MKNVIITGASGFIGQHTLPLLAARGYTLHPLRIDLSDPTFAAVQIKTIRPDALLHLAWDTTPGIYWHTPANLDWLKSSLTLLEAFAMCGGRRAVIAGSCAESIPNTLYGASKESLRLTATNFLRGQNISFAWGRIFSPYGPHENRKRLIPSLIQKLLQEETFECTSKEHIRDFLFVEDVAEAFAALLDSSIEGTIDIGSGEGVRIGDLATHIARRLEADNLLSFTEAPIGADNPSALIADNKRLFEEVGFQPKHSLHEGVEKTINWWKHEICH